MSFLSLSFALTLGLFLGLVLSMESGLRLGRRWLARNPGGLPSGMGAAEGAIFGLMSLLIAFSFSGAASRFEARKHLITSEANAIGTAYLRLDLLPPAVQPGLKQHMQQYVDARLASFQGLPDTANDNTAQLQRTIWQQSQAACRQPEAAAAACQLLLPALNEMFDITTTRAVALKNHPPLVIFCMLAALSLLSALLVGFGMSPNERRNWVHILLLAFALSMTIYVIMDLEFPRLGLIRVDTADKVLMDLRSSF